MKHVPRKPLAGEVLKETNEKRALRSAKACMGIALCFATGLATLGCGRDDSLVRSIGSTESSPPPVPWSQLPPTGLADLRKRLGLKALAPESLRRSLQSVSNVESVDGLLSLAGIAGPLPAHSGLEGLALGDAGSESSKLTSAELGNTHKTQWRDVGAGALHDWRLFHKGLPVERVQIKEQREFGRSVFAQGNVPRRLAAALNSPWPENPMPSDAEDFALSEGAARDAVAWRLNFHPWRTTAAERVYVADDEAFVPAFRVFVDESASLPGRGPGVPLSVLVDARTGEIIEQTALSFHVDGKALLYDENAVVNEESGRKDIVLPALQAPGDRLKHGLFNVYNCDQLDVSTNCVQSATGNAGDFRGIDFESKAYDEVVAYHAVTKSMGWYRKIMALKPNPSAAWGADYPGPRGNFGIAPGLSFNVYVRSRTKTPTGYTLDNAAYMPSSLGKGSQAKILIGTGWEEGQPGQTQRKLRYLGRDTDVVMHEFGHHIVYRTLRDVSGQGGAIHEGTADYLTYAITGNNLLGESIVASGESLRAGNKTGTVDPYVGAKPHVAGEFWSSTLWEVRKAMGPWKNGFYVFDKIVWESIDLLKQDANYYDFISALSRATEQFAKSENRPVAPLRNTLFNIFHKRGFLLAPGANGALPGAAPALSETNYSAPLPPETTVSATSEEGDTPWYQCGVVAGVGKTKGSTSTPWPLVALLLLPLCAPIATHLTTRSARRVRAERSRRR
jgi:hypothetical protein